MSRAVYIGGFGNGRTSADKVGYALETYYEDVDTFTFSDYVNQPEKIHLASLGVDLMMHSSATLALEDQQTLPETAIVVCSPTQRSIGRLMLATVRKTARMATPGIGIHGFEDVEAVIEYTASSVGELVTHPMANLGSLSQISKFNVFGAAERAKDRGVYPELYWTDGDEYSSHNMHNLKLFADNPLMIPGVPITILDGVHDEVVLRPEAFLEQVFNR